MATRRSLPSLAFSVACLPTLHEVFLMYRNCWGSQFGIYRHGNLLITKRAYLLVSPNAGGKRAAYAPLLLPFLSSFGPPPFPFAPPSVNLGPRELASARTFQQQRRASKSFTQAWCRQALQKTESSQPPSASGPFCCERSTDGAPYRAQVHALAQCRPRLVGWNRALSTKTVCRRALCPSSTAASAPASASHALGTYRHTQGT